MMSCYCFWVVPMKNEHNCRLVIYYTSPQFSLIISRMLRQRIDLIAVTSRQQNVITTTGNPCSWDTGFSSRCLSHIFLTTVTLFPSFGRIDFLLKTFITQSLQVLPRPPLIVNQPARKTHWCNIFSQNLIFLLNVYTSKRGLN